MQSVSDKHHSPDLNRLVHHARASFGVDLSPEQLAAFKILAAELQAWNEHTNLTAITAPEDIEIRHFLDSISLVKAVRFSPGCKVIDVGTGAGFPGLPLKIIHPKMVLTCLEATGKKINFINHVIQAMNLSGAIALHGRAEEVGQMPEHREQYDIATARAVARLSALAEYMLPLLRVGGTMVALKGESAAQEISAAQEALRILGGEIQQLIAIELPEVTETHHLVLIKKVAASPAQYPRRPGLPSRKPL